MPNQPHNPQHRGGARSGGQAGGLLRSSYNFVDASEHVFLPDEFLPTKNWSKAVSHDLPFSDGVSGWLEIEVTAHTPLYIRNGGDYPREREDRTLADRKGHEDFYRIIPDGTYAIPGSSFRGMLRVVLEIITFGQLQQVRGAEAQIDAVGADHRKSEQPDFAQTLLGYVRGNKALKGRVMFEPLLAVGTPQPLPAVTLLLGSPRSSFVPNYLRQVDEPTNPGKLQPETSYETYEDMNPTALIRGWKRYLPQPDGRTVREGPRTPAHMASTFRPLPEKTKFSGRLSFHNLRPAELGALVWALTWGGDPKLRHQLGLAKAYGFGSVSVAITAHNLVQVGREPAKAAPTDYAADFTALMEGWAAKRPALDGRWRNSAQVRQLLAFADPAIKPSHESGYPELRQFRVIKEQGLVLPSYPLAPPEPPPPSLGK